ncbi:UDP-N-acetylmuramate:L-alanyl-gamma-D-glutamyl-meso-diaminopimelate ligase [candidate division KSB1 bacterium]|nr:UDP-N-acetylmuramate:L-alanyl-gamma-D-glutamyl-meso-diaminopimelate ligase [candidate division KSB1 bacterium]
MNSTIEHIHLIAICGTAMGSIAAMLKSQGYKITGSDEHVYPPMSTFLEEQGIHIYQGFDEKNLQPHPDLVIIGNAMSRGNPEVEYVLENKIRYTSLPLAIKDFFLRGKHSIVVSGTHGKTTTSSLIAWMLEVAGKKPSFLIGGIPLNFKKGFKLDSGDIFVVEGDEYDSAFFDKGAKFFHYMPDIVVLNNIEFDHADIYDNLDQIKLAFRRLINLIPRNGLLIACGDDTNVRELLPAAFSPVQTFGLADDNFWKAMNIKYSSSHSTFDVTKENSFYGTYELPLSGNHNIRNALATIAVADFHDLPQGVIQESFTNFKSIKKRLEIRAQINGITIYDDFAHHPTEAKTTIDGLKNQFPNKRLWAIFEPRTATAKRKSMEKFYIDAFDNADITIFAPLHLPHKVNAEERISVEELVSKIRERQNEAYLFESVEKIIEYIVNHVQSNDLILIMSNGAFGGIHDLLIERLSSR